MKKILLVCSTSFYDKIPSISEKLIEYGYEVIYPNCYDTKTTGSDFNNEEDYNAFYRDMYYESRKKIEGIDELLVLNFDKNKNGMILKNYVGASTFLEIYESYMQNKKIYLYNILPDKSNVLYDDLLGMSPILLNGDISNIKK